MKQEDPAARLGIPALQGREEVKLISCPLPLRPGPLTARARMRLRTAAFRARRTHPGPPGDVIASELRVWEDFGHRLGGHRQIRALVDQLLEAPLR